MSPEQLENQEIWKQVKNSEKLFEIYKYFPTFHDAKIKNIEINLERKEFYLTVDYLDLIGETKEHIKTRFTTCWRNLQKVAFNWVGEDLYGIDFSRFGDFIKTTFEYGFDGILIASEIEILNIEIEPEKDEDSQGIIRCSIN